MWPLAWGLLPFIVLSTLNSGGYRYGASDLAFYVPAALKRITPALFPRDAALIAAQAKLTGFDEVIGALARVTGAPLPPMLAVLYVVSLALLAGALWLLGSRLYRSAWTTTGLMMALTLRHAISRSGTNTLEGYFHPRQLAFSLGVLALAGFLRQRRAVAIALIAAAALLHPTTALWFAIWIGVATMVEEKETRLPLAMVAAATGLFGVWCLVAGPLTGRLSVMDPEWLATLSAKDYLFPFTWPADVWLVNLGYAPLILWLYRGRVAAGAVTPGENGLVVGCLSLLLVFAAALPFNAMRVALAVQLQTPRIFWMLDFLATIYAVWALAEWARAGPARARVTAIVIAAASLARGSYVMFVKFPERPVVELQVPANDWGRAMAWARSTPAGSGWLADPWHAVTYGTSLRVAGERDVFVEAVKDAAIGMYERSVAIRTRDHMAEVGDFATITAPRARALGARYELDYLVSERALDLPIAFQSGPLRVYRLR
ncbi:MAG: hypothetical protein V7647_279 [Acidobacteriota bacterium]